MKKFILGFLFCFLVQMAQGLSDDYGCEVMEVHGEVYLHNKNIGHHPLKQGDILKPGDTVEVTKDAQAHLAYDQEWNNVTTIEENSKMEIRSIYPTNLFIEKGAVLAKLNKLPKGTSFQLSTPVNVAAVRGSIYELVYRGETAEVYNFSSSPVEVFGFDEKEKRRPGFLVLHEFQKTQVSRRGILAKAAERMTEKEKSRGMGKIAFLENKIQGLRSKGRFAQVQNIKEVEKKTRPESKEAAPQKKVTPKKAQAPAKKITPPKKPVAKKTKALPAKKPKKTSAGTSLRRRTHP